MNQSTGKTRDVYGLLTPEVYGRTFGPGKILFVRHGEKEGHSRDADLNENGRVASVEAGKLVQNHPDLFLASTAIRAVHTVEGMREGMGSDAVIKILDCLRGLPVKDKPEWSRIKNAEGRLKALSMWRDGDIPSDVLPPFGEVARGFLEDLCGALPEGCSVIAGTHDHQMRFIALLMGTELDGRIGYLDGIMFDVSEIRQRLDRLPSL